MPQPAIQSPVITQRWALAATTATGTVTPPIRPGFRPYTEKTRGKRPATLVWSRNIAAATAPGTAAALAVFGCEFAKDTTASVDSNGRLIPGFNPASAPLNVNGVTPAGAYRETIKVSGGTGTGITPIIIDNPGSGYTSAPTIVVNWLKNDGTVQNSAPVTTQATATALISEDGRVVGAVITDVGAGYTVTPGATAGPPIITFSGGGGSGAAASAGVGAVLTINTHIPHAAHAPTTAAGAFWYIVWRGRVIAYHTGLIAPIATVGLDPDQLVQGTSANYGFTEATGTHPDGTTTIGVLTLVAGIPNGDTVTVHCGSVKQLTNLSQAQGLAERQIKTLDVMWVGCATTAGSTETSVLTAQLKPVIN